MRLGANEQLLKTYNYYTSSDSSFGTLVVTNRRVVSMTTDAHGEVRSELRVRDIRSIESGYHKITHSLLGLMLIILGALCAIVGIANFAMNEDALSIPIILIGLVVLVAGIVIYLQKKMQLFLVIGTSQVSGYGMSLYATNDGIDVSKNSGKNHLSFLTTLILLCIPIIGWGILASHLKGSDKSKKIKIKIDENAALGIVDELSSIVWEIQASNKDSYIQD